MTLSLVQTQHISELAEALYSHLPGSSQWGAYTFADAAAEAGVAAFWTGGSKLPAITTLLENTLDKRSDRLVRLVEVVVRQGLKYRSKKGDPVTREEVLAVRRLLGALGFHSVQLGSESFLAALPTTSLADAVAETVPDSPPAAPNAAEELAALQAEFLTLCADTDRQAAGRKLEDLLNRLFRLEGLDPHQPFRVVGEQIDGSFEFRAEIYLLEAKWTSDPTPVEELLVFREKVGGKSPFTRGVFVSINGFVTTATEALTRGKQSNFVMLDGTHLYSVLQGALPLSSLLANLVRLLAERGEPYVPMLDLQRRSLA